MFTVRQLITLSVCRTRQRMIFYVHRTICRFSPAAATVATFVFTSFRSLPSSSNTFPRRSLFRTVITRPSIVTHLSRLPSFRGLLCPPRTRRCPSRTRRGRRCLRWPRLARLADRRWPDDHAPVLRPARRLLYSRTRLLLFTSDFDFRPPLVPHPAPPPSRGAAGGCARSGAARPPPSGASSCWRASSPPPAAGALARRSASSWSGGGVPTRTYAP